MEVISGSECLISFAVPIDWPVGDFVLQLDMVKDGTLLYVIGPQLKDAVEA